MHECYVYILTSKSNTVLYTDVINNLMQRVLQHRSGLGVKFTSKYRVTKLVYFEAGDSIVEAIAREKQIKAGSVRKKIELIEGINPGWRDLMEEFL